MQWLIDIITDWLQIRGNLPPSYVNRDSPTPRDFGKTDLTFDDAWHDLDLSAIIPEHAIAVNLHVKFTNTNVTDIGYIRQNGYTQLFATCIARPQVAGLANCKRRAIGLDANRKIEYKIPGPQWTLLNITVKGWWF